MYFLNCVHLLALWHRCYHVVPSYRFYSVKLIRCRILCLYFFGCLDLWERCNKWYEEDQILTNFKRGNNDHTSKTNIFTYTGAIFQSNWRLWFDIWSWWCGDLLKIEMKMVKKQHFLGRRYTNMLWSWCNSSHSKWWCYQNQECEENVKIWEFQFSSDLIMAEVRKQIRRKIS